MSYDKLEKKLLNTIPLKHFITTGFSRNSLYLLIKAFNWDNKAEVIIPAFTCPVIPKTIEEANVIPVPVDSEKDGINIDPLEINLSITDNTKAIYIVHTYGTAAKIEQIMDIAKRNGLIVIEDVAHALYSVYNGKYLGTFGDFVIISFTKKVINFEGGAIGTNNTDIYNKMLVIRKKFKSERKFSINDAIDKYVRLLGSWWESRFSYPALILMKINDLLNSILYKGGYGIKIDNSRFFPSNLSNSLTVKQLEALKKRNCKINFSGFRKRFSNYIQLTGLDQDNSSSTPDYYSGILKENNFFLKLISFRTWHNFNQPGKYPRADYLYSNYRIFSKIIMFFRT